MTTPIININDSMAASQESDDVISIAWDNSTDSSIYTINDDNLIWDWNNVGNSLSVKGDANIDGDLIIKGQNISETLSRIEERLAILHPNTELEAKWDNLRKLREDYMKLEQEIIEKEKVWAILNR